MERALARPAHALVDGLLKEGVAYLVFELAAALFFDDQPLLDGLREELGNALERPASDVDEVVDSHPPAEHGHQLQRRQCRRAEDAKAEVDPLPERLRQPAQLRPLEVPATVDERTHQPDSEERVAKRTILEPCDQRVRRPRSQEDRLSQLPQ